MTNFCQGWFDMKVLILSASTGGGHMSAANALKGLIESKDENSVAEVVDCIEYVSRYLNATVSEGYKQMAMKTPALFGALYKSTNKESPANTVAAQFIRRFSRRLLPLIAQLRPDVVVTTHAFAGEMISELKKRYNLDIPIVSIITDFAPHRMYVHSHIDNYIVSSDKMITELENFNVDKNKILSLGIPINVSFYNEIDKRKELLQMGLNPDLPTLLIMAGSFGVTDILKMYAEVCKVSADFQIIVITGKNPKLFNAFNMMLGREAADKKSEIENLLTELKLLNSVGKRTLENLKKTVLLYYTTEVEKYMHASDLIITKPGGLTVSESLACGLPMAIFKAFPGQEEENCDFLLDNGAAVRITKSNCKEVIEELLSNPERLDTMKENCKKVSKYQSAESIYNLLTNMTK